MQDLENDGQSIEELFLVEKKFATCTQRMIYSLFGLRGLNSK